MFRVLDVHAERHAHSPALLASPFSGIARVLLKKGNFELFNRIRRQQGLRTSSQDDNCTGREQPEQLPGTSVVCRGISDLVAARSEIVSTVSVGGRQSTDRHQVSFKDPPADHQTNPEQY